ncbi:hypothetical protein [Roseovarius rhodophyticola]|uniref:Uncharacterized protein n=1 Tax=Roseovarius rhodophyticola TaxID=3080827 RepID=A0ABZ2TC66_9RHOB|nr:hypothetical protein [Roseovarius sp. W115]MDV2931057.1 hypothetical protein [Roseovarius sp. W115]
MRVLRALLLAGLLAGPVLLGVSAPATAQTSFNEAVELWLQGNDRDSLPALAVLAQAGDRNARILLARIETFDRGPSPFRFSLSGAERRALFRQVPPNEIFGKSWLKVEAERGNKLAERFLKSRHPTPDLGLIKDLWDAGEGQATDYPTRVIALYGNAEQKQALLESGLVTDSLAPFLEYLSGEPEPRGDGLAALRLITGESKTDINPGNPQAFGMAGFLALGFGFGDASPDNAYREDVEKWVLENSATRPIADLCNEACSQEAGACAYAFLALSGGYFEVIRLDTPYQSLISQQQFLESPRARIMTLRRVALARVEANTRALATTEQIAEISSCAADLVAAERALYK